MRQRPLVLHHLAEVAHIDIAAALWALDEVLRRAGLAAGLARWARRTLPLHRLQPFLQPALPRACSASTERLLCAYV
jgi:hypothetical protein